MDVEQLSKITVNTDLIADISKECNDLLELQKKIEKKKEELKTLEKQERLLSEETIPSLMHQAGVLSIVTSNGNKVDIKKNYFASITVKNREECMQWLRDNEQDHIIENQIITSFDRTKDNEAKSFLHDVMEKYNDPINGGVVVSHKESVHGNRLKKWYKERTLAGQSTPTDLFGTFIKNETKIITKE